ncbi:hypothetical protein D9758_011256 [Tetrapyrgos nigripes]|uniref:C2H2-type domain-containing protein n=1 Tax=Tetrapyrgos nigripes TaxID=182062 RepID=A0A8H5FST7_9AGAR|nr:hypothetical protein D9758_011256 [Tetrapyrgos nigripes]
MSAHPPHPIPMANHHNNHHNNASSSSMAMSISNSHSNDYPMSSGSYNGSNSGSFNPASYTRHFLGSPISWRAGSLGFGGRSSGSYVGGMGPMDQLRGSLESRGMDPELSNACKIFDLQDELCRNYTCCGLHLTDLHALLEHFEQVHIVVVDAPGQGPQTRVQVPFDPQIVEVQPPYAQHQQSHQSQLSQNNLPHNLNHSQNLPSNQNPASTHNPQHYPTPVDPDDMELEPAPPLTPSSHSHTHSHPTSPATSHSSSSDASSPPVSTPNSLAAAYPGGFPYSSSSDSQSQGNRSQSQQGSAHTPIYNHSSSPYPSATSPYHSPYTSPYASQPPSPPHGFGGLHAHTSGVHGVPAYSQQHQPHQSHQGVSAFDTTLITSAGVGVGKVPGFQPSSSSLAGATTLPSQAQPGSAQQERKGMGARRPSLSLNLAGSMDGVESTANGSADASSTSASGSSTSTATATAASGYSTLTTSAGTPAAGYAFNVHPFSYNNGGHPTGHSTHGPGGVSPIMAGGMNANGMNSSMGSVPPMSPMSPMSPMTSFPSALAAALVDRSTTYGDLSSSRSMGGDPQPGMGYVTPAMLFSNAGTPEPEDGEADAEGDFEDGKGEGDEGHRGRGKDEKRDKKKKGGKGAKAGTGVAGSSGTKEGAIDGADTSNSISSTTAVSATSSLKKNRSLNPVGRPPNPNVKSHIKGGLSALATAGLAGLSGAGGVGGLILGASKPFKCPKPNCNKSYKQANGLKYHITHGSCSFAPPKDLEHVQALLDRKRKDRAAALSAQSSSSSISGFGPTEDGQGLESAPGSGWNSPAQGPSSPSVGPSATGYGFPSGAPSTSTTAPSSPTQANMNVGSSLSGLSNQGGVAPQASGLVGMGDDLEFSESELLALSQEAEKKLKPFACGIGDCTRRYKNMNGLRYHYAHTGEHGAIGLNMLASGIHECLQNNNSSKSHSNHHHKDRDYTSNYSKEREGRKSSQIRGLGSKPASRANSRSRTGTPLPPSAGAGAGVEGAIVSPTSQAASFAAAQIQQLHHAQSAVPPIPSPTISNTNTGSGTAIAASSSSSSGATSMPMPMSMLTSSTSTSSNSAPVSTTTSSSSSSSLTPTPSQIQAQAQAHLMSAYPYQQKFLELQRAQYAAQMQHQHQQQQQQQVQDPFLG